MSIQKFFVSLKNKYPRMYCIFVFPIIVFIFLTLIPIIVLYEIFIDVFLNFIYNLKKSFKSQIKNISYWYRAWKNTFKECWNGNKK